MGSRRKLILASLLSLMMALAFLVGLVPSYTMLNATAATGGNGRVDMVDLLNEVLNLNAPKAAISIAVTAPESGSTIKIPADSSAFLVMESVADGDANEVVYGIDGDWIADNWLPYYSSPVSGLPYRTSILVDGSLSSVETSHVIYAFANATIIDNLGAITFTYSVRSSGPAEGDPVTSAQIGFIVLAADSDVDKNGIVDDLTNVGPGETWLATYTSPGGWPRTVAVANLGTPVKANGKITVNPTPEVQVTAPQAFELGLDAGESAYLIVESSVLLSGLIDNVDGSSDPASLLNWYLAALDSAPLGGFADQPLMIPGKISAVQDQHGLGISLLAVAADHYREITTLPEGSTVDIAIAGLTPPANRNYGLWSYPLAVAEEIFPTKAAAQGFVFKNSTEPAEWSFQGMLEYDPAQGMYAVAVSDLSIFAPFNSTMVIYGIYDNVGPSGVENPVEIKGNFGYTTDLTLAETQAAFAVYFLYNIPSKAMFDMALPGTITGGLTLQADGQTLPLTTPGIETLTRLSTTVRVYDLAVDPNKGVFADVPGGYDFAQFYNLTLLVSPDGAGTVTAEPNMASYPYGQVVTLTATANAGFAFVDWTGNVTDNGDGTATLTITNDETVTANFRVLPQYALNITIDPAGGGDVTLFPDEPVGGYYEGTLVTMTANAAPGFSFNDWAGDFDGAVGNVATVTMNGDKNITAMFTQIIPEFTLTVNVEPPGAGMVVVDPMLPTYPEGTVVQLTATPTGCFEFSTWEGPVDDTGSAITTITMTADSTVTVFFVPLPEYELNIVIDPDGSGMVTPTTPATFCAGTVVDLNATPTGDYSFWYWEGDVADAFSAATTTVMDTSKTVTAHFILGTPGPVILSVTPNESWIFGGVRAMISGNYFQEGSTVTLLPAGDLGEIAVTPISVTATEIVFIVPPLEDAGVTAGILASVLVTNPDGAPNNTFTLTDGFTYWHFRTEDGVTTTAFEVGIGGTFSVALGDDPIGASLTLPAQAGCTGTYGIVQATKTPEAVLADNIDPVADDGDPMTGQIPGIWDFAVHLYSTELPADAVDNTLPLGVALYPEIENCAYDRGQDNVPAMLEFPVADTDTAITAADVRLGLTMWSIGTDLDYGTLVNTVSLGAETTYQSTLVSGEVNPGINSETADATEINAVSARLYDLSAFSLRKAVPFLPADVKAAMVLDTEFGTGTSLFAGGVDARIISALGGLGWVKIAFGEGITDTTPFDAAGLVPVTDFLDLGESEFQVTFTVPAFPDPHPAASGDMVTTDIAIYLASDLTKPVKILSDSWQYTDEISPVEPNNLWLILLGLAAALIGLAAGGDSGGGGGGPCFIATAAYGTPMAADVDTLRAFRDAYLLNNALGTAFVDTYYRVSPFIADVIARSPFLMGVVRIGLMPIIALVKTPMVGMVLLGLMVMLASVKRMVRRREH